MMKLLLLLWLWPWQATAEPWISTRYAQNCGGCHVQGRRNLPPPKRRCTLACQGCHVSPNGGGLRSYYGKYNEEVWLRSFRSDDLKMRKSPAPFGKQVYGRRKYRKGKSKVPKEGFSTKYLNYLPQDEKPFDKYHDKGEKETAEKLRHFEYYIPKDDPYREMMRNKFDVGADIRWQVNKLERTVKTDTAETTTKLDQSFPMVADIAVSYRPLYRRLRFVYEGRAAKRPDEERKTEKFMDTMTRRSLYVMVDEIPYNLYVMAGFYRPLFGYYTADHTMLAQKMQAAALTGSPAAGYGLTYDAVSFGGSPNVPYANVHLINRQIGPTQNNKVHGFATNLGGRFVTLSANLNYSYWLTSENIEVNGAAEKVRTEMHSLYGSMMVGKFIFTIDLASLARDNPAENFRQGGVYTVDTFYKLWRESYLNTQYSLANVAQDLTPGSGSQFRIGVRSFITNGWELSLHYEMDEQVSDPDTGGKTTTSTSGLLGQIHLFL